MSKDTKESIESKKSGNEDAAAKKERVRKRALRLKAQQMQGPMYVPDDVKDPNYHYRIVNDAGSASNVPFCRDLGYEVVQQSDLVIGDEGLANDHYLGSVVSRTVDKGTGQRGILMRIPKDLYDELQELEHEKVAATEKAVKDKLNHYTTKKDDSDF